MALDRILAVEERRIARPVGRAFRGAFHDYVRGVFAEHSGRARALRASRTSWLRRLSQRPRIWVRATNLYSRD